MLRFPRGTDQTVHRTIRLQGAALDLTGAKLWFKVKRRIRGDLADDSDLVFEKTSDPGEGITIVSPSAGTLTIDFTPADLSIDPGDYQYELWLLDGVGKMHLAEGPSAFVVTATGGKVFV